MVRTSPKASPILLVTTFKCCSQSYTVVGPSRWEWWCLPWRASPPRCPPSAQRWTPSRRPTSIPLIRYRTSLVIWFTFFSLLTLLWIRKHPWESLRQSFLNFFCFWSCVRYVQYICGLHSMLTTAHNFAVGLIYSLCSVMNVSLVDILYVWIFCEYIESLKPEHILAVPPPLFLKQLQVNIIPGICTP